MFLHRVLLAALLAVPAAAHAFVVGLDTMSLSRNATLIVDTYSDGVPPPSGPLGPDTYALLGTFPAGSEANGRLFLDTSRGILLSNAADQQRVLNGLIVRQQLLRTDSITFTGRFDLAVPQAPLTNGYGLQLTDALPGQAPSQLLQLGLQYNSATGVTAVAFLDQNFVANTITTLAATPFAPPSGTDQVEFSLTRVQVAGSLTDDFRASFTYLDDGFTLASQSFAQVGTMFQGEDFVQARLFAAEAIPEPSTYAMLLAGLAGLAAIARRRAGPIRP
jgi:hypothetical protein